MGGLLAHDQNPSQKDFKRLLIAIRLRIKTVSFCKGTVGRSLQNCSFRPLQCVAGLINGLSGDHPRVWNLYEE
jgi:hypothetical protein